MPGLLPHIPFLLTLLCNCWAVNFFVDDAPAPKKGAKACLVDMSTFSHEAFLCTSVGNGRQGSPDALHVRIESRADVSGQTYGLYASLVTCRYEDEMSLNA
jgi:hypothetical protein